MFVPNTGSMISVACGVSLKSSGLGSRVHVMWKTHEKISASYPADFPFE